MVLMSYIFEPDTLYQKPIHIPCRSVKDKEIEAEHEKVKLKRLQLAHDKAVSLQLHMLTLDINKWKMACPHTMSVFAMLYIDFYDFCSAPWMIQHWILCSAL